MAATATIVGRGSLGDMWVRLVDVTLDGSYPAGGYPLAPKDLGIGTNGTIMLVDPCTVSKTAGWMLGWDFTNNKLQVFDGSGAASVVMHEVAAATVLTGVVGRLLVLGKGSPG